MKQSIVKRALLGATAMLALALFSAPAHADAVDFSCAGSNCTGTVVQSGVNYSTTGIGGLVQSISGGPDYNTGAFTLVFDTATDIASLTGNAAAGGTAEQKTTPWSLSPILLLLLLLVGLVESAVANGYLRPPAEHQEGARKAA